MADMLLLQATTVPGNPQIETGSAFYKHNKNVKKLCEAVHQVTQTEAWSHLLYELLHSSTPGLRLLPRFGFLVLTVWLLCFTWEQTQIHMCYQELAHTWCYGKKELNNEKADGILQLSFALQSRHILWEEVLLMFLKTSLCLFSISVTLLSVSLRASVGLSHLEVLSFKVVFVLCDLWWRQR